MRDELDQALDQIRVDLGGMSDQVGRSLAAALGAFQDRDRGRAELVVAADTDVDAAYAGLQQEILVAIALHAPVGVDLRELLTAVHVSRHLERMGDHAVNVARSTAEGEHTVSDAELEALLVEMGEMALGIGEQAVRALLTGDDGLAALTILRDDEVDALHAAVFQRVVALAADPAMAPWATRMVQLSRQFERYADNGVDIAEHARALLGLGTDPGSGH